MSFRVLGPLELGGDCRVAVTAGRQRIVLAMLLLEANRVVPLDRLVEAVWEESPPATARGQIQICVSALRRLITEAGLGGRLLTRHPGYLLQVEPGELDLHTFDQLLATARAALSRQDVEGAASAFREAMGLHQGMPFVGIESQLVRGSATRITERRLGALEEYYDLELQLGRHREVLDDLLTLVAQHPLRERLVGQLMTAQYRADLQVDALETYRAARRVLVSDLGLEPAESLRSLERAILNRDPGLDLPAPRGGGGRDVVLPAESTTADPHQVAETPEVGDAPRMTPADIPDFSGRSHLAADLSHFLGRGGRDDPDDRMPVLIVAGSGGIGKTALAVHVAHKIADDFPDGQLFVQLGGTSTRVEATEVLRRLLRMLGVADSTMPSSLDELAAAYRSRLAGRRLLVILDDAADEHQVRSVLPGSPTCAVVITSRARLVGIPGARLVDVGPLDTASALALLSRTVGQSRISAEPSDAMRLVELCAGLPLALRIVGARLASRPHWGIGQLANRLSDEDRRLDELVHGGLAVRESIERAYHDLEPQAMCLFRRLGLLESEDFSAWVAGPLLGIAVAPAMELLERLVDARLVDVVDRFGDVRYHLQGLSRLYAREQLSREESGHEGQGALNRLFGAWQFLADRAHRQLRGGDYGLIHSAAARYELPESMVQTLLRDPLLWYERERTTLIATVLQAARVQAAGYCWDLAMTTATMFRARDHVVEWRKTHSAALLAARENQDRRGEAAMLYSLAALDIVEERFDEAAGRLSLAVAVFEEVGERHGRALALRHLALLDRANGNLGRARERSEEVAVALHAAGDLATEAEVLMELGAIDIDRGAPEVAAARLDQAWRAAAAGNSARMQAQILCRMAEVHVTQGAVEIAERELSQALALAREAGDHAGEADVLQTLGLIKMGQGRYDKVMVMLLLSNAYAMARHHGDRSAVARCCLSLAKLHHLQQDARTASEWLRQAADLLGQPGAPVDQSAVELFNQLDVPAHRRGVVELRARMRRSRPEGSFRSGAC